jgi:UDP-N-acetyl-D-mannosaminuronic acid dehydrogenase
VLFVLTIDDCSAPPCVGLLGLAFKGGSDDIRSSLSYNLRGIPAFKAKAAPTTDPCVTADPGLRLLAEVFEMADLLVVGTPHPEYRELATDKPIAHAWNVLGDGAPV